MLRRREYLWTLIGGFIDFIGCFAERDAWLA